MRRTSLHFQTSSANCMTVGDKYIFIGCAEGIVRCFSPSTLQFITTLPRTHYLGVDVAQGLSIRFIIILLQFPGVCFMMHESS